MGKSQLLIGAIIVLISIIILLVYKSTYQINGVWVADESFLNDAGLNQMILYIDDKTSGLVTTTRSGYLYADNEEGAIEDQKITLQLTKTPSFDNCVVYNVKLDNVYSWDSNVKFRFCTKKHILTVLSEDTVFAEFYKDNQLSDYANTSD